MDKYEIQDKEFYLEIAREHGSFEEQLKRMELTKEEVDEITKNQTLQFVKENGLPLLGPLGNLASAMVGWSDEVNEEIRKKKQEKLLMKYFEKTEDIVGTVDKLYEFMLDPHGFLLFNKFSDILGGNLPDSELIEHLSTALKKIVMYGNFEELFDKHKYVLSQFERLTPQSITIISDFSSWPQFELAVSTYFGGKISSEFHQQFSEAYSSSRGITAPYVIERISHSVRELQNANIIEGFSLDTNKMLCECRLTNVGEEIYNYLN